MKTFFKPARRQCLVTAMALALPGTVLAHDFKAGDIVIDHPYATPSLPGARTGAVYFRGLRNTGRLPDRLVGARTAAAGSVEVHRMVMDGDVMRMGALDTLAIPAGGALPFRHGGQYHLMLLDLKSPLVAGDRFKLTLRFERGGEQEVTVWVQQPRERDGSHRH
ncbi:copper chaperone PCu(A)C [Sphaerotilus sp.]|uniref:copper chaperone PCu(A)C n=1 Tax=Sphaerotilus sp. TaxID=2093942 RepID=UPI002ACD8604|nr:copper chaperone PCu(A)C [Sphaerotilus sp.]MDZ7855638.1 copper chaperone PCu(A)C [Sphaerotilus sp.]